MENETVSKNFIENIIDKDLAEGVYDTVHTRFPPEPNGLTIACPPTCDEMCSCVLVRTGKDSRAPY